MGLKQAIKDSKHVALPFVVGLSIYSSVGLGLFFMMGKEEAHSFINSYHTAYLDQAFKYITHLGHGLFPVGAFAFLLLIRYSWALALGLSSALMGIIVQSLKRSVFAGDHRPAMFFADSGLPSIDGIVLMTHHSFPSGHSATGLCIFAMLAFFIKQKWATYLMMVIGILVAFSRVYISQHFIQDTVAGAWIGFGLAFCGYAFIIHAAEKNPNSKLNKRLWPSS
jgi:membrane-associated phospholipid phosphatase